MSRDPIPEGECPRCGTLNFSFNSDCGSCGQWLQGRNGLLNVRTHPEHWKDAEPTPPPTTTAAHNRPDVEHPDALELITRDRDGFERELTRCGEVAQELRAENATEFARGVAACLSILRSMLSSPLTDNSKFGYYDAVLTKIDALIPSAPAGDVEAALKEIREMFPGAACSIEHVYRSGFGTPEPDEDDPIKVYECRWVIWVKTMPRGEGATLVEAMQRVREFKAGEPNPKAT